jgi:hypothetical protein
VAGAGRLVCAAGMETFGGEVQMLELAAPQSLAPDEAGQPLLRQQAQGVRRASAATARLRSSTITTLAGLFACGRHRTVDAASGPR